MERKITKGCIYLLTNLVNGKHYVGQHKNIETVHRRWNSHIVTALDKDCRYLLHRAIRKYGLKNFSAEVIWCGLANFEKLNTKEIFYVKKYHSFVDDSNGGGYNLTTGGEQGKAMSKAGRQKMSKAKKEYFSKPGMREANSERRKAYYIANPEARERSREVAKRVFGSSKARKDQSKRAKKQFADPAVRKAMSELKLKQYEDPALRSKVGDSAKAYFANTPGAREANAARVTAYAAVHPEQGKRHSAFMKARHVADPTVYSVQVEAMRLSNINGAQSARRKQYFKDHPEDGAVHSARLKALFAKRRAEAKCTYAARLSV